MPTDRTWWRQAAVYQIYPRSFSDTNGDGRGDLPGVTARMDYLSDLGIDAIWLSPFYPSALADGGYDVDDYRNVDPRLGSLADFDAMVAAAHAAGIKVIVDIVPNHSSNQHAWFQEALAAPRGSAARARYIFRDGQGANGELPPSDWTSVFGGPAWTQVPDGQWYLHLFASEQPDFNWDNREIRDDFLKTLRFWSDRGVDGFRIDVAHALMKDLTEPLPSQAQIDEREKLNNGTNPLWDRDEVHEIYAEWRALFNEYNPPRTAVAEAWVDQSRRARYASTEGLGQAFNFDLLRADFEAASFASIVTKNLAESAATGASSTWVFSNHDVVRHATRFGYDGGVPRDSDGIGPGDEQPDTVLGRRRAAASTLFMLGLPGAVYLYQGEELGLPDHTTLADEFRQDPTFARTGGERLGRDGCRIPLPWRADAPLAGFSGTAHSTPWLPLPEDWSEYARDLQAADPTSHLNFYRQALTIRKERSLGTGSLQWVQELCGPEVLAFSNGSVVVMLNTGHSPVPLPAGTVLLRSRPELAGTAELQGNEAIWLEP